MTRGPEVISFNGVSLNTFPLFGYIARQDRLEDRRGTPVAVDVAGQFPSLVRVQPDGRRRVPVHVLLEAPASALQPVIDFMMQTFAIGTAGPLLVDFDGETRVLDCTVIDALPRDRFPQRFTAILSVPAALWREENPTLDTDVITTSGQAFEITNAGDAPERQSVIRVQPTDLKEGAESWPFADEIIVVNRIDRPFVDYALDITDGGWDHGGEVTALRSLASGDDVRVLVDGVDVPRWESAWDQADTKVWIRTTVSAGLQATLNAAMTAVSPADGESIDLGTANTDGWPETGFALFDDELIKYGSKSRNSFDEITRAARGTTAAVHTVGTVGYWAERRIQLVYGYLNAPAPLPRDDLEPLIDRVNSTNTSHVWPNFADNVNPRSMQWTRALISRDDQADRILSASGEPLAALTFEYQAEGAQTNLPAFNEWLRRFPSGLANGGGGDALSLTRSIDETLALVVFGVDRDGNLIELSAEGGPVVSGVLNVPEPVGPIFDVEFYARSQVSEKNPDGALNDSLILAQGTYDDTGQQFTAPDDLLCTGVIIRMKNLTSNSVQTQVTLYSDDGADAPGSAITAEVQVLLPNPGGDYELVYTWPTPVDLQAGSKYWLQMKQDAAGFSHAAATYKQVYDGVALDSGVVQLAEVVRFRVLAASGERFGPFAAATDGDQVVIDDVTANLDSAGVPYVNQLPRGDVYWLDGVLSSQTTGQELAFAILCALNDEIEVDVGLHTVNNITSGEPAAYGLTPSDPEEWITLWPGVNTWDWTEPGIDEVTIDTDHFGRWE